MCWWHKRLFFSLFFILYLLSFTPALLAQECAVKPDATLKDARIGGIPFVNCTSSSITNYNLKVENASSTISSNTSYTIDWGDNSPIETFVTFTSRLHTYRVLGSFKLRFTVNNGTCSTTKEYSVFNGSVPKLNIRLPGDTYDCAPATFTFTIEDVDNNEPSTTYTFSFDDGTPALHFTQSTVPKTITHTFVNASIGKPRGFTITGTATNACNATGRTADGIYVSNGPTPDFKMSPDGVSCLNGQVTLTDVSDYGFNAINPAQPDFERKWQIEPATGWSFAPGYDETSVKPVINFTQTGVYNISINLIPASDNQKCKGGSAAKTLRVITPPTANFTTTLSPVSGCASTVATVNNSVGELMSYQWTVTPNSGYTITSGSLTSAAPVFKFNTAGNYQLGLKVNNNCGTDQKSTSFQIKNIPTVTLPAAKTYCGPQTIAFSTSNTAHKPTYNFNNATPISYNWNIASIAGPAGGAEFTTSNGATLANPTIQFSQVGTYIVSVKATNECGISTQASQTVTINAIPTAPTVEDASICINSSATLTTTTTGTIDWYTTATGGTKLKTGNSYPTPVYNTAGNYTVYVQTTVNGCTSSRTPVTITVSPAIDPKVISGAATICEGNTPNLLSGPAATGGANTITYLWESTTQDPTVAANANTWTTVTGANPNNAPEYQPGALTQTTWFRRKVIANPCGTAASAAVKITVNPLAASPVVPAIPSVCVGNTATFTANAVSGITFTWYDENGSILSNNSASSNTYTTAPLTHAGTYTYYVTGKNNNNCTSARTSVSVQVLPAISNNRIISEQPAICAGETPTLINSDGQPNGGDGYNTFTYLWQSKTDRDPDWKTAVSGTNAEHANNKENYQPTGITRTTTFRRVITSGSCATPSYSNEVVIQVVPSSLEPEVAPVNLICTGESTQLQVTSTGGTYEWFTSATSTQSIFTGSLFTTPALKATTTYYVQNRTANCVSPRTPVIVTVNPFISKNTIKPVPPACADGTSTILEGSEPEGGVGPGTYTYRWASRTEFTSFAPINGDFTFSKDKKDHNPGNLKETTWFQRIVRSGTCENDSAIVKVEVLAAITGNTISATGGVEFCVGAVSTTLTGSGTISGGTGQYTYVWESSTDEAFQANKTTVAQGAGPGFAAYVPQNVTQNTWFRRIVTSGPCLTSTSNSIKITVNPLPAAPVVAPINPICAGSAATITVNLVDGATFAVYDEAGNSLPAHSLNSNQFTTPALTEPKTYTYYIIAKNSSNCSSARTIVTIQVLEPLTNFNITQPAAVCTGESPNEITSFGQPAGGNNTFTYIWESKAIGESKFTIIISASSNPSYKPAALTKTTYFRRQIISGACAEYSNVIEVKVNELVVNTLTAPNQEICEDVRPGKITGAPATGGDGSNYSYLWQSSRDNKVYATAVANPGESNTQVDFQPALLQQGEYWFRRQVTSGACISYSNPVLIKVNKPVDNNTLRLTGDAAICTNTKPNSIEGSVPSGGTGKPHYTWQSSTNGINFINASQPNTLKDYAPGNLTQTTWFRRIVEAASCLPDTSTTVKVEVYQPVINNTILTKDQEICLGNNAPILVGSNPEKGNGPYTYRWESRIGNQPFATAAVTTTSPTEKDYAPGLLTKGVWYFRRWVSAGPCQETVSQVIQVIVNNPLSGHFITANQIIRVGDKPATLTGPRPNGGNSTITYRWESKKEENGAFEQITGNTNLASYSPPVLNKTTWFRRIAVSGGCESISNPVEITVAQAITDNTIAASQIICYNAEPTVLAGSAPSGGNGEFTFVWEYSNSGLPADFVTAPNLATNQDYQPGKLKENTWFRRKVSSAGNTHISNSIKITVAEPITGNSIAGPQTLCYGATPTPLSGSAVTGGSGKLDYLWESSTDGIHFLTAPGSSNQPAYTPGALTRTTWYRRNVSTSGCIHLASNVVQITVIPVPVLAPVNPITICPGSSATLTVATGNYQIEWFETVSSSTPIHTGSSFATLVLTTERTYYVQAVTQGCAGERIPVKVLVESPVADAGFDTTIEAGKSAELLGKGGATYQWAPAEGLSNPNIANPVATPTQTTRYTLTVTTAEGCTATDEVVVALLPGISVPNGFTPNNDGTNDVWEIANIEKYPDAQIKIFNRWGTIIYTSVGYKQPWDGTYNQQNLPVATYYYTIVLKPGEKPVSGSVTIIK